MGIDNFEKVKVLSDSENKKEIEAAWRRSFYYLVGPEAKVTFIDVMDDYRYIPEEVKTSKDPMIFYGLKSENTFLREKHPLAPYFFQKNGVYFEIPFNLEDIINSYHAIEEGKKFENVAARLWAEKQTSASQISILLHDISPWKKGWDICEQGLAVAKQLFGISGTIEEVVAKLEKLYQSEKQSGLKKIISSQTLPGVFCDIDDTLVVENINNPGFKNGYVNEKLWVKLQEYSQHQPVTLWTGGDLQSAEEKLIELGINRFPILPKHDFAGCRAEMIIDDYRFRSEFEDKYKIQTDSYYDVNNFNFLNS